MINSKKENNRKFFKKREKNIDGKNTTQFPPVSNLNMLRVTNKNLETLTLEKDIKTQTLKYQK